MSKQLDARSIASMSLHDPAHFNIQRSQTRHRMALIHHWNITIGSKVLEIGCGQGDCTTVLADALGAGGKVVALDPASLDYGSPYTLGQAQSFISQGSLGKRITWIQQRPLDYLASLCVPLPTSSSPVCETKGFDYAVLVHSVWYFSSPSLILSTFRALKQHSKHLLLAEWSLIATDPSAQPHVLAVLAQAALESRKAKSNSNIRTALGPKRLIELALAAGWQLESEAHLPSGVLSDGKWEVSACLSSSFERQIDEHIDDEREREVVIALRDACKASVECLQKGSGTIKAMDTWAGRFI